jgi:hypothetical protein
MMFLENGGELVTAHQDMKNDTAQKKGASIVTVYLTSAFSSNNFARRDDNY